MKPAYITCIKNEEDLIYKNMLYYYNLGIRDYYIMFNNSNDETTSEVHKFEKDYNVSIIRFFDTDIAYRQPERFGMMSNAAYNNGCDWIIPVDSDEIMVLTRHNTIQEYLNCFEPTKPGYIQLRWIDYQPGDFSGDITNYFTDWEYRDPIQRQTGKIIVKWDKGMAWGDGHHLLTKGRHRIEVSTIAYYAHFPNRSYKQLKKKVYTIGKAFIETFGEDSERTQVQTYHKLQEDPTHFDRIWEKICRNRDKNKADLVYDPINKDFFK